MPELVRDRPHIYLPNQGRSEQFTGSGRSQIYIPDRDRAAHAAALTRALTEAVAAAQAALATRDPNETSGTAGFYLDFVLAARGEKEAERLADLRRHIELVAVTKPDENAPTRATVFVPQTAANHFLRKVEAYRSEQTPSGKPKNQTLVANLETISRAAVLSIYTDDPALLPSPVQKIWWEIWLRPQPSSSALEQVARPSSAFERVCERLGVLLRERLRFPEREVRLAYTDQLALARLMTNTDAMAEIRIAKDTPSLLRELPNAEQQSWSLDLLSRVLLPIPPGLAVCVLDTGMTRAHPLLSPALNPSDVHIYDKSWPDGDSKGHGTNMGGLVLYGDLMSHLLDNAPVSLTHCLESVKMLRGDPQQQHKPELYGAVMAECVARAEIAAPRRRRAICMAVTSDIGTNRGRPSSWSAEVDQLCFGDETVHRLVLISAGNINEVSSSGYPARNEIAPIENPAQAWNALTIGAYTEKSIINDPTFAGWQPLAPVGDLSRVFGINGTENRVKAPRWFCGSLQN